MENENKFWVFSKLENWNQWQYGNFIQLMGPTALSGHVMPMHPTSFSFSDSHFFLFSFLSFYSPHLFILHFFFYTEPPPITLTQFLLALHWTPTTPPQTTSCRYHKPPPQISQFKLNQGKVENPKIFLRHQLNQQVSDLKIYEFGFAMFVGLSFRCWWGSCNFEFSIYVDGFEFLVVMEVGLYGCWCVWPSVVVFLMVADSTGFAVDGGRFSHHHHSYPLTLQGCPHLPTIATNHQRWAERKDQDIGLIWVWCLKNEVWFGFGVSK